MLTDSYYIVLGKDTKEEVVRYLLSRKVPSAWTTDIYKAYRFYVEEHAVEVALDIANLGKNVSIQKITAKFIFDKPNRIHSEETIKRSNPKASK